jgi:hypothetical protein
MVIEHTFVTTLDAAQALHEASSFLGNRGFTASNSSGWPADATAGRLEMQRGKENAARAKNVSELPQNIRLDFDRGRVAVALSITPSATWGGKSWASTETGVSAKDVANAKKMKLHHDLLVSISSGLEDLLVQRAPQEIAVGAWISAEGAIADAARRHKRQMLITLLIVILVAAGIIGLVVYSVNAK